MLYNQELSNIEKQLLKIFINKISIQRDIVVAQINQARISREVSPYFVIIKFKYEDISFPLWDKCHMPYPTIQFIHSNGDAPTVLTLFVKEGIINGFEIYNADSTELNLSNLFYCDVISDF